MTKPKMSECLDPLWPWDKLRVPLAQCQCQALPCQKFSPIYSVASMPLVLGETICVSDNYLGSPNGIRNFHASSGSNHFPLVSQGSVRKTEAILGISRNNLYLKGQESQEISTSIRVSNSQDTQ